MQKLHLVGFTTDHSGLIFSARKGAKSGSFVVPLDGPLRRAVAELERLRDDPPIAGTDSSSPAVRTRQHSDLSVREVQDRLRAGGTIEEVAAEAGVDTEWVARFAVPILAEQARVVDAALGVVYDKPRFGASAEPLGPAVRWNVADRGVVLADDQFAESWGAYQIGDGVWVVRFRYTSRGRPQVAEWTFEPDTGHLASRNRLGAQLGYLARRRSGSPPRRAPSSRASEAASDATEGGSTRAPKPKKRAVKKKAPAKKRAVKKKAPVKKRAVKKKAPAKKRAVKKKAPVKKRAVKKKAPVKKRVVKKKAPVKKRAVKKKAPVKKRAVKKKAPVPPAASLGPAAPPRPSPAPRAVQPPTQDRTPPRPATGSGPAPSGSPPPVPSWAPADTDEPVAAATAVDEPASVPVVTSTPAPAPLPGPSPIERPPPGERPVFRTDLARPAAPDGAAARPASAAAPELIPAARPLRRRRRPLRAR